MMRLANIQNSIIFTLVSVFVLTYGSSTHARTKLSFAEVNALFIDKVWIGSQGEFLFKSDGNYSYYHCINSGARGVSLNGPWKYKMNSRGKIKGETTSYTFYKTKNGYSYYHSRSGNFYRAIPTNKVKFDCAYF
jgi:hypothetical protein